MIRIYDMTQREEWDGIVRSFSQHDVYYLSGYVHAFQIHGDGEPQLLFYEADGLKAIYVYMKRKTDIEGLYDSVTPYGYGGVLFEGDTSEDKLQVFWRDYVSKMRALNIVDNFVRYHPVLRNSEHMSKVSQVIDLGKTIAIDLLSKDIIWNNFTSKNRNHIRKAINSGVEIFHGKGMKLFNDFERIYNLTMDKDHATDYYYFNKEFYHSIHGDLFDNYEIFYATYNGSIIAMSIMLFANNYMHYHLSGALYEYRNIAPTNLLLYEAAVWGYEHGCKYLHLGGGVGSKDDDLYKFKASFNKCFDLRFSIGKQIFIEDKYEELVQTRSLSDASFDLNSSFFPLYRQ